MGSRARPSTSIWDHHITPTTRTFFLPVYNEPVTLVPTKSTVFVAYFSLVVSTIMASSAVATPVGTSHVDDGQPSSGEMLVEGAYDDSLHTAENPNVYGPAYYYDSDGQPIYISSSSPDPLMVEVSVPFSVAWGPTSYRGGQARP